MSQLGNIIIKKSNPHTQDAVDLYFSYLMVRTRQGKSWKTGISGNKYMSLGSQE